MDDETKRAFVDTNGFLQVRDLKDIPWRRLFPTAKAVDVMVAPSVINELDQHKISTNQRRRDRARLALRMIDQASRAPDLALVVRESPVRVRIVISAAPRFNWAEHTHLDSANPDDQLVAEALSFGNGAVIFSHDTGPRIRARIAKVDAYEPAEEWLLPVEQTDDQRTINKIQGDLKRALAQFPSILAGFGSFDAMIYEIALVKPRLTPLDRQLVTRLAAMYIAQHPPVDVIPTRNEFPWSTSSLLGGISSYQVDEYQSDYSSFTAKVHEYYATLHESIRRIGAAVAIDYWVKNDSGVAAQGLRIEFDLDGLGSFLADREDISPYIGRTLRPPQPPEPPGPYEIPDVRIPANDPPRDPVVFYWFERPELGKTHSACQCQEFRPTREFADSILVLVPEELPTEFILRLHVEAGNLPAPVNVSTKVVVDEKIVDWSDPLIRALLPPEIYEGISSAA